MDSVLSAPPRAHIPVTSYGAESSAEPSPFTSPTSSRPPSPPLPLRHLSDSSNFTSAPSSAAQSRSSSKDPLFKQRQQRDDHRSLWHRIKSIVGGERALSGQDAGECIRGRRPSLAAAEAGQRPLKVSASVAEQTGRRWPMSRERAQTVLAFLLIILVGTNDSATGANLSSMREYYQVSFDEISLTFLAITAGYAISCTSASLLQHRLGVRWSLHVALGVLSAGCILLLCKPPFPAFICALVLVGFGNGLCDACITTVISHEESAVLLSWLYSCFGIGAMASPLLIGGFTDKGISWSWYYAMPLGLSAILALASHFVFAGYVEPEDDNSTDIPLELAPGSGAANDTLHPQDSSVVHGRARIPLKTRFKRVLKMRVVWIGFVLIIVAFGTLDTLSAWMVDYLTETRHSPEAASRYMLSGLWAGIASGRIVVSWLLDKRLGERTFAIMCLTLATGLLGIVWAVKQYVANAVALAIAGFFLGPITPKILSMVSVRVPPSGKSAAMSLTIGLGLVGSAIGPLFFGFVAGRGYLAALPGVLIVVSVLSGAVWMLVPANKRRED